MTDRETELHRVAAELRDHETIDDAFLAKSFTDRHLIVDVSDDTVPEAVAKRLAEHDLYGADEVYGDETDARSFAGTVGDGTRHHFVDVRTRDSHQSYVVNRLGVKPRGFPWINRTLPSDHRSDNLGRSSGSRSGRPRPPMPAVAPSELGEGC